MTAKIPRIHINARKTPYLNNPEVHRSVLADSLIPWAAPAVEYTPNTFTAANLLKEPRPVYADPDIADPNFKKIKFNQVDGNVDRVSFEGKYQFGSEGQPLNPIGRTGLRGRGFLGRWGPNHAADPIATRWKRNEKHEVMLHAVSKLPILQFIAIQRRDNNEWAIPGGMVNPGEQVSETLKREFSEEALNSLEINREERNQVRQKIDQMFNTGSVVYRGYVDDPRNTDNAWMETLAMHFHDEVGDGIGKLPLKAGDDAIGVQWMDISDQLKLFASHVDFIRAIAKNMKCHWNSDGRHA